MAKITGYPYVSMRDGNRVKSFLLTRYRKFSSFHLPLFPRFLCSCYRMDLDSLPLDHAEILMKLVPNEEEMKKFEKFKADKKLPDSLPSNDRFIFEVRKMFTD